MEVCKPSRTELQASSLFTVHARSLDFPMAGSLVNPIMAFSRTTCWANCHEAPEGQQWPLLITLIDINEPAKALGLLAQVLR